MTDVVKFYPADAAKDADNVLEWARGRYSEVLIIGYNKEGQPTSQATLGLKDGGDILWLIEHFKLKLLMGDFNSEGVE